MCCSWLWAEAGAQQSLEQGLELGGFGYPALTVVNAKKKIFATLRGAFSYDGINEFLRWEQNSCKCTPDGRNSGSFDPRSRGIWLQICKKQRDFGKEIVKFCS